MANLKFNWSEEMQLYHPYDANVTQDGFGIIWEGSTGLYCDSSVEIRASIVDNQPVLRIKSNATDTDFVASIGSEPFYDTKTGKWSYVTEKVFTDVTTDIEVTLYARWDYLDMSLGTFGEYVEKETSIKVILSGYRGPTSPDTPVESVPSVYVYTDSGAVKGKKVYISDGSSWKTASKLFI